MRNLKLMLIMGSLFLTVAVQAKERRGNGVGNGDDDITVAYGSGSGIEAFPSSIRLCVNKSAGVTTECNLRSKDVMSEAKMGVMAKFIKIKAGEFTMGSPENEHLRHHRNEKQHKVVLESDYEIQATEVTQLQYFLVTGQNPSINRMKKHCDRGSHVVKYGISLCANHPVEMVSFIDIQKFMKKLNKMQDIYNYRLPTEEEWEYAARGGRSAGFPYSFGYNETGLLKSHAWYDDKRSHAVATAGGKSGVSGTGNANGFGLYDMHGNVWEWVVDIYSDNYSRAVSQDHAFAVSDTIIDIGLEPDNGIDRNSRPKDQMAISRVMRGGSWGNYAYRLRTANRIVEWQKYNHDDVGFRLVRVRR